MTLGLAYWIIILILVVFGVGLHFGLIGGGYVIGGGLVLLVLLILLGWQVFGPPLHK